MYDKKPQLNVTKGVFLNTLQPCIVLHLKMEVVHSENIKVPNSVIVSGLSGTKVDEEVFDYLKQFGSISRSIEITIPDSEHINQVIVEYTYGDAVEALEHSLPLDRQCTANPNIIHHIASLSSVYSSEKGSVATSTFLSELKNLAKLSGKSFEDVLKEELGRITESIGKCEPTIGSNIPKGLVPASPLKETVEMPSSAHEPLYCVGAEREPDYCPEPNSSSYGQPHKEPKVSLSSAERAMHSFQLSPDQLSTPEVQRVVVEHIVKSTEIATQLQSAVRLKPFSGRVPCPNHEIDYDTWRCSLEFYMTDASLSDGILVRKIVDSLLPPAANVVKPLGLKATPKAYLDLLDSAYATVEDGDELFVKFLNTNQNSGEKPSSYLQRLQIALNTVLKKKVIPDSDANRQLLKQFCRGCWNNNIIATLQLEQKKDNPPTFTQLLLLLRTEEDRIAAKDSRMKQHLGLAKAKAQSNAQVTFTSEADFDVTKPVDGSSLTVNQLQKQIAGLQAQLAALTTSKREVSGKVKLTKEKKLKSSENPTPKKQASADTAGVSKRPKPWYCFRCGEDGHIASGCDNPSNPALVSAKRKELQKKREVWEKEESMAKQKSSTPLN